MELTGYDELVRTEASPDRTEWNVEAAIPQMVERIAQTFKPRAIILFGSRARGDARPDSDVDLLVVFESVDDKRQVAQAIRRCLRGLRCPVDVVVATTDELTRLGSVAGYVYRPALREGVVLHAG